MPRWALTPLGSHYFQFLRGDRQTAGATGAVVRSGSNLAFRTWPESSEVMLDMYVCNFSRDNGGRGKDVFDTLRRLVQPVDSVCHQTTRGRLLVPA